MMNRHAGNSWGTRVYNDKHKSVPRDSQADMVKRLANERKMAAMAGDGMAYRAGTGVREQNPVKEASVEAVVAGMSFHRAAQRLATDELSRQARVRRRAYGCYG